MNDWQDAELRFERALELVRQRKWPLALEEMKAATSINPFNASWFYNLGVILDEMTRHEEALEAFGRALQIEPDNLVVRERLGVDLYRTGRLKQAIHAFERLAQIEPSHEPSYCHRILIYSTMGRHEQAEEMFYTARLYKDECPRCYDHMGRSLLARGRFDRAIFCFQRCLDLDPSFPSGARRLAAAFWGKGDLEQARRQYLAELRHDPGSGPTLLDLGNVLMEMGRVDEAGEKFRRCIELLPDDAAGYFHHGRWLVRAQRRAEAQLAFRHAIKLDPTFRGAHLELARIALSCGQRYEARQQLRAEHLMHPEEPRMLLALANLWMDCGHDRTAIACLKRLLLIRPADQDGWLNLAVAQFRRGLYPEGKRSCTKALQIDPRCRLAMHNLALAEDHMGHYSLALEWTRQAMELEPRDAALKRLETRLRLLCAFQAAVNWVRGMLGMRD